MPEAFAVETPAIRVDLLRESFKAVSPKADELVANFYELLFTRYPQVKPLFDTSRIGEQKNKLLRALSLIVTHVDRPEYLAPYLQGLGRMHVAYGTMDQHYPAVGECLLAALEKTSGPAWSAELNQAWAAAYGVVAKLMMDGARG